LDKITTFRYRNYSSSANQDFDPYKELGISYGASSIEIKKAYHKRAKQHHPDVTDGDRNKAKQKFVRIVQAFEMIGTEEKRKQYLQNHQIFNATKQYSQVHYTKRPTAGGPRQFWNDFYQTHHEYQQRNKRIYEQRKKESNEYNQKKEKENVNIFDWFSKWITPKPDVQYSESWDGIDIDEGFPKEFKVSECSRNDGIVYEVKQNMIKDNLSLVIGSVKKKGDYFEFHSAKGHYIARASRQKLNDSDVIDIRATDGSLIGKITTNYVQSKWLGTLFPSLMYLSQWRQMMFKTSDGRSNPLLSTGKKRTFFGSMKYQDLSGPTFTWGHISCEWLNTPITFKVENLSDHVNPSLYIFACVSDGIDRRKWIQLLKSDIWSMYNRLLNLLKGPWKSR